ncbi:MAG: DMT family transporter [Rhodothermia bacterium]|nr:DMT family transporter [Rhodothermia bacterium]
MNHQNPTPSSVMLLFHNGIFNMTLAAFSFALMGASAKWLGNRLPSVELMFFRNIIGVMLIGATLFRVPLRQKGGKPGLLIFRGIIGTMALFGFFYNLTHIPLAEANTYNLTYPIFIGLISATVLRNGVTLRQWLHIALGFIGILLIFRPNLDISFKNHLLGLWSGLGAAIAYLAINQLRHYYDHRATVLSFMVSGIILPLIGTAAGRIWPNATLDFLMSPFVWPVGQEWLFIACLGLAAMMGQIFVTRALSLGNPAVVGPINYLQIPFAILLGLFMGDAFPDNYTLLGIGLVILSGILITTSAAKPKSST